MNATGVFSVAIQSRQEKKWMLLHVVAGIGC